MRLPCYLFFAAVHNHTPLGDRVCELSKIKSELSATFSFYGRTFQDIPSTFYSVCLQSVHPQL